MPSAPPKVQVAAIAGLTLALGFAAGALLWPRAAPLPQEVRLHVPGAISVSAYCGGDVTHRTTGDVEDTLVFAPDGRLCEIEAPLSPVMPLRGRLEIGTSPEMRCVRSGVELVCGPSAEPPRG